MMTIRALVAAAFVLASARGAHAQLWSNPYNGTVWNNPTSSLISTMITNNGYEQALKSSFANQGQGQGAAAPQHEAIAKTDFQPAKQRLIVEPMIDAMVSKPELAKQLVAGVGQVFDVIEKGMRKNNVATGMAFMLAMAVQIDKGVSLNGQQMQNLAVGLNDYLARTPAFVKAGASDRQKMYEMFITMGALMGLLAEAGKTDPASLTAAKALSKQALTMVPASK